jgi:hypothetical protein
MFTENISRICWPKIFVRNVNRKYLSKIFLPKVCSKIIVGNVYQQCWPKMSIVNVCSQKEFSKLYCSPNVCSNIMVENVCQQCWPKMFVAIFSQKVFSEMVIKKDCHICSLQLSISRERFIICWFTHTHTADDGRAFALLRVR